MHDPELDQYRKETREDQMDRDDGPIEISDELWAEFYAELDDFEEFLEHDYSMDQ